MGDLNRSLTRLQGFDLAELDDVEGCQERWFLKVNNEEQLTAKKFMEPTKSVLSGWLADARDIMERQREMTCTMKEMIELLKTEALADKAAIIRLQTEQLQKKDEQLQALQTALQDTVQGAVKTEMRSYGDVLRTQAGLVINPSTFKKVVKDVMKDEDRSKNLMVFGLVEAAPSVFCPSFAIPSV